jgi:hypothetical protein
MENIDVSRAGRECLAETDRIVGEYGPRLAGTRACSEAAEQIAASSKGFADSVTVEPFRVHPVSFYAYTKVLPVSYVLGMIALLVAGRYSIVPLVGLAVGIVLMLSQFAFYWHWGDALFSPRTGKNVEAVIEPAGPAEQELILSGHHDSAPVARIFSGPFARFYVVAILAPYVFFLFELGVLLAHMIRGNGGLAPVWTLACLVLGLPFVVGYFFLVNLRRGSPGAGDNLISSVMAVRIGKEIAARREDLLRSTRLRIVSFDAEEAGLRGSAAYFRRHAADLGKLPCVHLNFDSLYSLRDLQVLTSDINGTVPLSRELVETVIDCARECGFNARPFGMIFGAGGTDAAESARRSIPSTSIIAMPTEIVREGLVYHTPSDTVEHIEPAIVEACMRIALRVLERVEKGGVPADSPRKHSLAQRTRRA